MGRRVSCSHTDILEWNTCSYTFYVDIYVAQLPSGQIDPCPRELLVDRALMVQRYCMVPYSEDRADREL